MGRDKATLPFGAEAMLSRIVRLVGSVVAVESTVCVAAQQQSLPPVPSAVRIVRDLGPDPGPLAGLAAGLRALSSPVDAVFVCGCDVPLLLPEFIGCMFSELGQHQIAAVFDDQRDQPLGAVYRADVLPAIETLLANGERSLRALLAACDTVRVPADRLGAVDPNLQSLAMCNTPEEYEQALRHAFPSG
jgi:molybdopterin-guanine dinucleotide biosynthesis protein A